MNSSFETWKICVIYYPSLCISIRTTFSSPSSKNVDKSKIELSQRYQQKQLEDKFRLHRDDGLLPLIEFVLHIPQKIFEPTTSH